MTTKPTIRELIDACRPDQHDPQRAELAADLAPLARELEQQSEVAEALKRSERFDRNVRSALDDVPLPAGFAERLLAKCEVAVVAPAKTEPMPPRFSRRKLVAMFSIAASLLIMALAGWSASPYLFQKPGPVSADQLAQTATEWFDQSGAVAKWQASAAPLTQFPIDRAVVVRPARWAPVNSTTVVYELKGVHSKRAQLFVHRTSRPHAIKSFPWTRLSSSGGVVLAAWQRDGYVYVLSVIEPDQQVHDFIKTPKPI